MFRKFENSRGFQIVMSTALLDLDLKEIGLPFTNLSCVLLFVVRPRSEKSSFVFGLNESLPSF